MVERFKPLVNVDDEDGVDSENGVYSNSFSFEEDGDSEIND